MVVASERPRRRVRCTRLHLFQPYLLPWLDLDRIVRPHVGRDEEIHTGLQATSVIRANRSPKRGIIMRIAYALLPSAIMKTVTFVAVMAILCATAGARAQHGAAKAPEAATKTADAAYPNRPLRYIVAFPPGGAS